MDSESDANLLLALDLSDSEPDEAAAPKGQTRAERSALSDAAFQALKETYKPKVENGELCKALLQTLPQHTKQQLPKPTAQALLHAVEELYFFRRYTKAIAFIHEVLGEEDNDANTNEDSKAQDESEGQSSGQGVKVDDETRKLLMYYKAKCRARAAELKSKAPPTIDGRKDRPVECA